MWYFYISYITPNFDNKNIEISFSWLAISISHSITCIFESVLHTKENNHLSRHFTEDIWMLKGWWRCRKYINLILLSLKMVSTTQPTLILFYAQGNLSLRKCKSLILCHLNFTGSNIHFHKNNKQFETFKLNYCRWKHHFLNK